MQLYLSKDGIFPITQDERGKPLPYQPASGFSFPGTIQGEGKLNGIPSLFIRLAGCNLHCIWHTANGTICECDTTYASFRMKDTFSIEIARVCRIIAQNRGSIQHLVITGGEPFLQASALVEFCRQIKEIYPFHITVETNATIYNEALADNIDLFSLSPKLASSSPPAPYDQFHNSTRCNIEIIQAFLTHAIDHQKDFQLKFVYSEERDIDEIKIILSNLQGWKNEDILLMPMGVTYSELQQSIPHVLAHCIQNGWRYCDRLHLSLFGNKPGV